MSPTLSRIGTNGQAFGHGGTAFGVADFYPATAPVADPRARFLFFGEARAAGNTAGMLFDQSGHGNHFTQGESSVQPTFSTDSDNTPRYEFNYRFWISPLITAAGSYEAHFAVNLTSVGNGYLFDSNNHSLLLGQGDALYYSTTFGVKGGGIYTGTGKHVISFKLDAVAGTGKVYKNGVLIFTGSYTAVALNLGRHGCDFSTNGNGAVPGYGHAFAIATAIGTDAEFAATIAYLRTTPGF